MVPTQVGFQPFIIVCQTPLLYQSWVFLFRSSPWLIRLFYLLLFRSTQWCIGPPITCYGETSLFLYSNANWAGCPNTGHSTTSYAIFFKASLLISWSSKKTKHCISFKRGSRKSPLLLILLGLFNCFETFFLHSQSHLKLFATIKVQFLWHSIRLLVLSQNILR